MRNTRFIQLFNQLEAKEQLAFQVYLHNDAPGKKSSLAILYRQILKASPDFLAKGFNKTTLWEKIYSHKPFNELAFNNLLSNLLQKLYEFLAIQIIQTDKGLQSNLLLDHFRKREINDFIPILIKRLEQQQNKSTQENSAYFWQQIEINAYKDYAEIIREKRSYNIFLQKENDYLDLYYHLEKLRIAVDMLSRQTVINLDYKPTHLEAILSHYEAHPELLTAYPAIHIYWQAQQMLRYKDQADAYFKLKALLSEHFHLFPSEEARTLYNYLLNYCVRKINTGFGHFYEEILSLYQFLLKAQLLEQQGKLTQWTFINILTAGLRLQNYEWTEDFVHRYKDALDPSTQDNVYAYSLATIYFEKGDLGEALSLLQSVAFTDAFYQLSAKIIQLKIYYLEESADAFFSLSLATQRYLSRNRQLSTYQTKSNVHFLKLIKRLFQLKIKAKYLQQSRYQAQVQKLKNRIQNTAILGNRKWLEQKLSDLEL